MNAVSPLPKYLVGLFLALTACSPPTIEAVTRGKFHVVNSEIFDPAGRPFVAKGVNVNGINWVWPGDITKDLDYIVKDWRFNLIRVNCLIEGTHFTDNNDDERIVRAFTEAGIVVVFQVSGLAGEYYTDSSNPTLGQVAAFHRTLAEKYRNNPYVWFEIADGPGTCDLNPQWLDMNTTVVRAIRQDAGASNIIIANAMVWGTDDGCSDAALVPKEHSAILSYGPTLLQRMPPGIANLVFGFHVTSKWELGGIAKMGDFVDRARALGLALIVNAYGGAGAEEFDVIPAVTSMFAVVPERRIGRVAWHWYNASAPPLWPNALVVGNGQTGSALAFDLQNPTVPTNLTALGRLTWADTHRIDGL